MSSSSLPHPTTRKQAQSEPLSHAGLVARAVHWLLNTKGCSIAFSEFQATGREIPDAIGFRARWSVVVECKASRADFLADRQKPWRRMDAIGMGAERYFMVPAGLITIDQIPPKWGLLWVDRHVKVIRMSKGFPDRAYMNEVAFLVSMLRRAQIRAVNAHQNAGRGSWPEDYLNQWLRAEHEKTGVLA